MITSKIWIVIIGFCVSCLALALGDAMVVDGIKIKKLSIENIDKKISILPLVEEKDEFWLTEDPCWKGASLDISAEYWLATTKQGVLFHAVVHDPVHSNEYHDRNLWRGDCIYLSLDACGDTSDEALGNKRYSIDDAVYIFGLGQNGPEGRIAKHGSATQMNSNQTQLIRSIVRNESNKTMTYNIMIPWVQLNSAYGQSQTMGVAVCIAHKNHEGKDLNWGRIVARGENPRQLHYFALETDKSSFATIAPKCICLFNEKNGEIKIAVRAMDGAEITTKLGSEERVIKVPASTAIQRYLIQVPVESISPASDSIKVKVRSSSFEKEVESSFEFSTPSLVMSRLDGRIKRLRQTTDSTIGRRHLDDTLRVIKIAYQRLSQEDGDTQLEQKIKFVTMVEKITEKLSLESWSWDKQLTHGLPMVFTFVSELDQTVQFYTLQFPYGWDAKKSYPLTVYLHGYGDPDPLGFLITAFDNTHQDTLFTYDLIDPENIPPAHRGFILAPWARGNSYYKNAGEDDVWQSMAEVIKKYKINMNKLYMSGFSMGCHGAWALATRTPDLWAGINTASGFWSQSDTQVAYLDENIQNIFVVSWIGGLDSMLGGAMAFDKRLTEKKINHQFDIVTNLPHTYPYDQFQNNIGKLMQHSRPKPEEFFFVADTTKHIGRNGIAMKVDLPLDTKALPQFRCRIEGNKITIESKNTDGLEVTPGENGLGLSGIVTIIWNGKGVYKGDDEVIPLGKPLPPISDRWARPFEVY